MKFFSSIVDWVATPYTIYLVIKEPRVSRSVKIRASVGLILILAYVVSPVDIIPDFIPFSGWLDDLIIVPLGLLLLRFTTPGIDLIDKRNRAQRSVKKFLIWAAVALVGIILLGLLWLGLLIYAIVWLIRG